MLKIDELKFGYQNIKVLENINLSIDKNEFIGIIGPNGSGKSTLLKNISKILRPDAGIIYLDEKMLNSYSPNQLAKKMAVVPQDTSVDFNFTVYDVIMMGRNPYQNRWGSVEEEDKGIVKEVMELTDTENFKDKKINQLSGGERQRVIIARALAQKPEILLLDEPTASLDINYCREIFDLLANLNRDLNITIITVSHDLNLTSQYCDRLVLLKEGNIFAVGRPEKVLTVDNISEVYRTKVKINENPLTDRPYIILIPGDYQKNNKTGSKKGKIHIVCGGGSGKGLIKKLHLRGYQISCGILNQGDADWEMAKKLNLPLVEIPPFSYIDDRALQENREMIDRSTLILVTDTPFGHGNIGNLKLLSSLKDKLIILQNKRKFSQRDYTGGKAEIYWEQIKSKEKSYLYAEKAEIMDRIKEMVCKN